MAKRGYKLQEFVAHSASVNCLTIGKKARRLFITGGDDYKVNLWTIGKPTSLMSLCGHTSPVESVAFDSAEVLVLAGASSGGIKLWDLEEAKMVRTLTGHRSNCTAVEFHPFGEFFASGSLDTNLRIWDIRKKGCIHTYRGHSQGVSTIKFTPDGRWVVSGGFDNAVKVWDLTAGKLLHDFKFHEGPIRSIDFHPLEFLLATGSADRTVKFWDLESFEMIGSARCEAAGVRSIAFHPDGRALFAGLEDGLKVYSWEPVICHDTVDMGWTTLGDLCIHDGKLLGCSYYRNSVGVWAADISLIEPYGTSLEPKKKGGLDHQLEKVEMDVGPTSGLHFMPPDNEPKEIKNIYIDSSGGKPVSLQRSGSSNSPKVDLTEDSKEICNLGMLKQSPAAGVHTKSNEQAHKKSFFVPNVVPRDISSGIDSAKTGKETINFLRTKPGMLLKPAHIRRASTGICDAEKFSADMGSGTFVNTTNKLDSVEDLYKLGLKEEVKDSCEDKYPIKSVTDQAEKASPHKLSEQDSCDESIPCNEEISPVKYVNGVAVMRGRTRSLVERFERKDRTPNNKVQTNSSLTTRCEKSEIFSANDGLSNPSANMISESQEGMHTRFERKDRTPNNEVQTNSSLTTGYETREILSANDGRSNPSANMISESQEEIHTRFERKDRTPNNKVQTNSSLTIRCETREIVSANNGRSNPSANMISESRERMRRIHIREDPKITISMPATLCEADDSHSIMKAEPHISERDLNSANEGEIIEGLMQTHDLTLSNLRSRLTKLQVVRHFWERNDVKGAINALRKLPDQSVQADVISVLVEKTDLLSLELFTCLFPVLIGLLDSKIERHVKLSLDLQLKLVSVFGPTIHSTIRAPPSVGVDLHAEQRREYCNQCFMHLQKIQKILPLILRRGGLLARSAQELNLVLQQS